MILSKSFEILRRQGWLSQMPEKFSRDLTSCASLHVAECGECVYRAGEPQDGLRGIVSGAFAIEMAPFERGPNLLHLFRQGDWFGELEIFQKLPKVVTLVATRRSEFIYVSNTKIEEMAKSDPEIWRWIGALTSSHLLTAMGIIDDMTVREPRRRISALLLRLANVRTVCNSEDPTPEIDVTQVDLAHLVNLSRATVSEHLKHLEEAGFISRSYGKIRLTRVGDLLKELGYENPLSD